MLQNCVLLFIPLISLLNAFVVPVSLSMSYDIGQTFNYKYSTTVRINELSATSRSRDISFRVNANVAVTNVWQNPANIQDYLLLLQVTSPELLMVPKGADNDSDLKYHQSALDQYSDKALVVHIVNGLIKDLYVDNDQSQFLDLKTGIASLFQLHLKSTEREELDSSGKCKVVYEVSGTSVKKVKTNCESPFKESKLHPNPLFRDSYETEIRSTYELTRESVISNVDSVETRLYQSVLLKDMGTYLKSQQSLNLVDQIDASNLVVKKVSLKDAVKGLAKVAGSLKRSGFHTNSNSTTRPEQCKSFAEFLNKRRSSFQTGSLAKFTSVSNFMDILQYSVDCSKESITKLLKYPKNKEILPQLLDVFAATQTPASVSAVLEFLQLEKVVDNIDLAERYLISLATVSFPLQSTIEHLLATLEKKFQNQKVYDTLLLTVGNLIKNYQINSKDAVQLVQRVQTFLINAFKKCEDYLCKLPYLRALKAAKFEGSLPVLLESMQQGGKAVPEVVLALRAMPKASLPQETKSALLDVFFQLRAKQDPSARILAAEALLVLFPSEEIIQDLLLSFNKTISEEMATYILSKMRDIATRDSSFKQKFLSVLKNPALNNYHILSQSGFSVTEIHPLPEISQMNASYEVKAEFLKGGVFKRSILGTEFSVGEESLSLLSFGTFAGGLASFVSSSNDVEDEEVVTAGMELNVMGVGLRPYTLFTGQGEVMGLLWSGAGSETTPIFQANMKLHDNKHIISLQNGLKVELSLVGAVSVDLSGSVQVSLWSRNSHSQVANNFAFLLRSLTRIDASFIDAKVEVATASDLSLDFITDSDFSDSPFKSCMLFQHDPFLIKQLVSKVEKVPGSARKLRRSVRQKYNIPGRCFALNRRVFEMCSQMIPN